MSYKKVMHFEDQKNRWMPMPADCGSNSILSRPSTVPYMIIFYTYIEGVVRVAKKNYAN